MLPFDLHVLGMPPAFNLSQDQTLAFNPLLLHLFQTTRRLNTSRSPSGPKPHTSPLGWERTILQKLVAGVGFEPTTFGL